MSLLGRCVIITSKAMGALISARPMHRRGGLIRPDSDTYTVMCSRFGVEARAEGWALWHTWGNEPTGSPTGDDLHYYDRGPADELGVNDARVLALARFS